MPNLILQRSAEEQCAHDDYFLTRSTSIPDCQSNYKQPLDNTDIYEFEDYGTVVGINDLTLDEWPVYGDRRLEFNSTSCTLSEYDKCPRVELAKSPISDPLYIACFFGIFALIIMSVVGVYRWCKYDKYRLEQSQKTRIASRAASPSDLSLASSISQISPLLDLGSSSRENLIYKSCDDK